jgi:hypothetical protein
LPTILHAVVKEGLVSEELLKSWYNQQIQDIDTNYLYNAGRDAAFKKLVEPYIESLNEDDEDDEE